MTTTPPQLPLVPHLPPYPLKPQPYADGEGASRRLITPDELVPPWSLEDVRATILMLGLRIDGLIGLLEEKGVLTRDEHRQATEWSAFTRFDRVVELLTPQEVGTPETPQAAEPAETPAPEAD